LRHLGPPVVAVAESPVWPKISHRHGEQARGSRFVGTGTICHEPQPPPCHGVMAGRWIAGPCIGRPADHSPTASSAHLSIFNAALLSSVSIRIQERMLRGASCHDTASRPCHAIGVCQAQRRTQSTAGYPVLGRRRAAQYAHTDGAHGMAWHGPLPNDTPLPRLPSASRPVCRRRSREARSADMHPPKPLSESDLQFASSSRVLSRESTVVPRFCQPGVSDAPRRPADPRLCPGRRQSAPRYARYMRKVGT
jgi:hypothetical protein